ncbi:MAG: ERCC4 domain-containing protein [Candidatus Micrarchaeia archaeon]
MIYIDTREKDKELVDALLKLPNVKRTTLQAGDYLVIGKDRAILISRKTIPDFYSSIFSRHLFEELRKMKEVVEPPCEKIIIIEGDYYMIKYHPNWSEKTMMGAMWSIYSDWGIIPMHVKSKWWLYEWLKKWNEEMEGTVKEDRPYPLRLVKEKAETPQEIAIRMLEGAKGISNVLAKRILKFFGSFRRMCILASEETLTQVEGIGKEKAKWIIEALDAPFDKEEG